MAISLFIEHHPHGFAFYINGDLQFDTADEAIYHEYLAIPAIALAVQRFPHTPLRVLICGGGDGLAARDVLRFPQVSEVVLVDYDPEVLELGRTTFAPYNQGSLLEEQHVTLGASRVTVHTQEAFEFIATLPDGCFHAVICDFTCPTRPEEAAIYSREWFAQVRRVLRPGGVLNTNAVSPEQTTIAFWCLYQTLLSCGFQVKPMRLAIPSFQGLEYGEWGFLLASEAEITRSHLETLDFPDGLRELKSDWLQTFEFEAAIARCRHEVNIHTLDCPQLFYYLLNAATELNRAEPDATSDGTEAKINFLEIQEPGTGLIGTQNLLELDAIAQVWLDQLNQNRYNPSALLPVQHADQTPSMTLEWLSYLRSLLQEVNAKQLLSAIAERSRELPPQIAQDLKQTLEKIRTGQLLNISERTAEIIVLISVTLLISNLAMPDAAFAKGSVGYARGSSGGSSTCDYDQYGNPINCDSGGSGFGVLGAIGFFGGLLWLINLYNRKDD
jgi:spermidine synthase